ncbi:MAG TPA: helix-turn-helix domain-containing protein [Candidatus Onthousia faecavium]|nr:helix-turn-helix domain-containing protein [Candidatus Onthousia faecavium]
MKVYKAYKFRLYPTDNQKVLIHKHFWSCSICL